jgi:hypothetical protein
MILKHKLSKNARAIAIAPPERTSRADGERELHRTRSASPTAARATGLLGLIKQIAKQTYLEAVIKEEGSQADVGRPR